VRPSCGGGQSTQSIDWPTLCILFLTDQAVEAERPQSQRSAESEKYRAEELHVRPEEIRSIDAAALAFAAGDRKLRDEARRYGRSVQANGRVLDPTAERGFSGRRSALAQSLLLGLQTHLSPKSFAGLKRFVTLEFPKFITPMEVRHDE
jgi:hypothetical protein